MEIIRIPRIIQDTLKKESMRGRSIGFVPTMGALHEGHLTLMKIGRSENDILVASIFVNPLQFGKGEDFERYPRDFEGDFEKLKSAGVDFLFMPDTHAMYADGFQTNVSVKGLSEKLCGRFRPGHFSGVATVVTKLLNIVKPKHAYFGRKDYQQSLVIERLVKDLNMDIEIVVCPTVREHDGLAMSSRNAYLNPAQRKAAAVIYETLKTAYDTAKSGGKTGREIGNLMNDIIKNEPLISEIQYAGAYDSRSLDEITGEFKKAVLAMAVKIGDVRLIDNMLVE